MFTNITYYVPFINKRTMCVLAVTGEFPSQRPVARSFDVFYLICTWTNGWANHRGSGDLWRHRAHYDVSVTNLVDVTAANDLATIARQVLSGYDLFSSEKPIVRMKGVD